MTRLLHTADWQIGRLHGAFDPDDAVPLAEARFAAIQRLAAKEGGFNRSTQHIR